VAAADPPRLVRTAPHRVVMNRIDHGADAATVTSVHRIETTIIRQSDAERGVGSDEMLNVQGEIGGNETSNIQGGIGDEC
jgi:hypothetical protein